MLKLLIITVASLMTLLYGVLPVGMGGIASLRRPAAVEEPPEGFLDLNLETSDGVRLAAWYHAPENGRAVILLHGAGSSKRAVLPYARMLVKHGFGVLAPDLRGHGRSGGGGNAFGWNAGKDVEACADYLSVREGIPSAGGLGLSLGGEVLLGSLSGVPSLRAVVSDGATHRSLTDYLVIPSRKSLVRSWTTRLMYGSVRLFTGQKPPSRSILDSIRTANGTRLFLIASGRKSSEIEYNGLYAEASKERSSLWVVEDAGHTDAFAVHPEEYEERVVGFFTSSL